MKSEARLLPRLDLLYLQKKSYEIHKKKLQTIRRSTSFSKRRNQSQVLLNQQQNKSLSSLQNSFLKFNESSLIHQPSDSLQKNRMQTIEQNKPEISYWLKKMNPHQKRLKQEQIKENKRMREKIKNIMSFVQQTHQIGSHVQHYTGIKRMLQKFSVDHQNNKKKLKCQIALRKITQIEKQKLKTQQSRIYQDIKSQQKTQQPKKQNINQKNLPSKSYRILQRKVGLTPKINVNLNKNNLIKDQNKKNTFTKNIRELSASNSKNPHNFQDSKSVIPKISHSRTQKYQKLNVQSIPRISPTRPFNNSKLSNLPTQTVVSKEFSKHYNASKVSLTQAGYSGFRRAPSFEASQLYRKQKISLFKKQNNSIRRNAERIKTEGTQSSRSTSFFREKCQNKFDYQRKKIERYLKSKSSLSTKQLIKSIEQQNNSEDKKVQGVESDVECYNKRDSIITENIEQSTIQIKHSKINQEIENDKKIETTNKLQNSMICFATEIQ